MGWNLQLSVLAPGESVMTLRQLPLVGSHSRQVPSEDADTMKSFATDQSKSVNNNIILDNTVIKKLNRGGGGVSFNSHNLSTVDPILGFAPFK